ncbi:hypothetical protein HOLleu_19003 [Holothuria leucospilota]|uniref:Uncharacterized protein n=1 Tax=Holothuria leucospilota TaxID=206669 RepID=A0A9Q1C420_HOLLE|nr:hypothetical protein HOLleu_19003 [Holothuria leucospilota]
MSTFHLIDIWRERNPSLADYSWNSNITLGIRFRLDFFLISQHFRTFVTKCNFSPSIQSDHSVINLDLDLYTNRRGPGFWKLNNSLLTDSEYTTKVKEIITGVINDYHDNNPSQLWEYIKYKIRDFSVRYSKKKAATRKKQEEDLLKEIAGLERTYYNLQIPENLKKLNDARLKLDTLYNYKLRGIIVRSRSRWVEQGEKNTKYFLNLENRHKSLSVIRKLTKAPGQCVMNDKDILDELSSFYTKLYHGVGCSPSLFFGNLHCPNFLTDDDASLCEGQHTIEECKTSLFSFKDDKSPGTEGLTAEFYKFFFRPILPT